LKSLGGKAGLPSGLEEGEFKEAEDRVLLRAVLPDGFIGAVVSHGFGGLPPLFSGLNAILHKLTLKVFDQYFVSFFVICLSFILLINNFETYCSANVCTQNYNFINFVTTTK